MRIMLVISSLRRGGAERVVSIMANHWAAMGHQVFLVTIEGRHADAYMLRPDVVRVALDLARVAGNSVRGVLINLVRIWKLRATARRIGPGVAVSFVTHTNLLVLMAMLGTNVPVIVSERTDPSQWQLGAIREKMRRWLYPRAAAVVVQTRRVAERMRHWLPDGELAVIANPVPAGDPDEWQAHVPVRQRLRLPAAARMVAAMGRLEPQKGFDLLMDAFSRLHEQHPDWHLIIFGDGVSRSELKAHAAELKLAACVHLPGPVRAARSCLAEADLFVLPSRVEGFPNVLLEAMACGRAVVSFDCPSGPGEIIRNGRDGVLVEAGNVTALAEAMSALMDSPARRAELGKNARQVLERFSTDRIMPLWDELLSKTCRSGGPRRDHE